MKILIVDDEEVLQDVLTTLLRRAGYKTLSATSGEEALRTLETEDADLVILDIMLPGISGLETLKRIRARFPELVVVIITAFSSIEGAIEAMRLGAFHYIPKPFKNDEVLLTIGKGIEQGQLARENKLLKQELATRYSFSNLIGKSDGMQKVYEIIRLAAPSKSNILIEGESGTGKELVAKAIHHNSPRVSGPFVTVNSGSLPADLLESNLFGHVRGAFTGAIASKKGLFEVASGGSIFCDEIGNVALEIQAKLLRVIQEREFMPVGSVETLKADVRLIAATNIDLRQAVAAGGFRDDLYYRLNVINIKLPPLRARKDDIPLLAEHFLERCAKENGKGKRRLAPAALKMLLDYQWPGNVRELENVIERAVVLSTAETIGEDLIPDTLLHPLPLRPLVAIPAEGLSLKKAVSDYERELIMQTLMATNWVQKRAAELLDVKATTLNEMMKRLHIDSRPGRVLSEEDSR